MSDPYLLTLHTLTLRQLADADQLREIIEQDPDDVKVSLERAVEEKTAISSRGAFMITPAGRLLLHAAYLEWFAAPRADALVTAAMDAFESGVNKQVLSLTTDWQTVEVAGEGQPNDHSDSDHDAKIIDKLGVVLDRMGTVLEPLIAAEPHVDSFLTRLGVSLTRAHSGEIDYVSGVRVDSFHTVWFQMHEHLLRITGRERPE
jgi:hypothetical protein